MKANLLNINGKKIKDIELPIFFSQKIRADLISKVIEIKKNKHPYSPSPIAGKQHSASGKIVRRRHVWKSGYGRGASRVPRKVMSKKGSQFNWVGAEVPSVRGGRRAHPPKILSMFNTKKINKKELRIAFISAISATANKEEIVKKYQKLRNIKIKEFPLIVESKITLLKTKELIQSVKQILGEELFSSAIIKKKIRSGRGKLRGRKYKKNAGLLILIGKKEKIKTNMFDIVNVDNLGISDLAKGGQGRLVLYTKNAITEIEARLKGEEEK